MIKKTLPTFIIGGTLPSGTGQLYATLLQHSEIFLPLPMAPECNFFYKTNEYSKGIGFYSEKYFSAVKNQKVIGERSSLLLSGARWTAARVAEHCPDVKIIFMLRNPTERAFANYRFTALSGFETLSFEQALESEQERLENVKDPFFKELEIYSYFKRGLYAEQLRYFYNNFPKENILTIRSDSLLKDYDKTINRILRFIGANSHEKIECRQDFSSPSVINLKLHVELKNKYSLEFADSVQRIREQLPLRTECDHLISKNVSFKKMKMNPETEAMLYEKYKSANLDLQSMVDFPVNDWFR